MLLGRVRIALQRPSACDEKTQLETIIAKFRTSALGSAGLSVHALGVIAYFANLNSLPYPAAAPPPHFYTHDAL